MLKAIVSGTKVVDDGKCGPLPKLYICSSWAQMDGE